MNKTVSQTSRLATLSLLAVALTGCLSAPEPEPVKPDPVRLEQVKLLREIQSLRTELSGLRNSVEQLQYESETTGRRQQAVLESLDERLVSVEQRATAPLPIQTTNTDINATPSSNNDLAIVGTSDGAASSDGGLVSLDEQQVYDEAFNYLSQSKYQDATQTFQKLIDTWPNGQLTDDAYYWRSEAQYVNREFETALSGYRTVVTQFPDSQRVPEAMLKIGYIQYDIGAYTQAADTFRSVLEQFPGHQVTTSAQTRLRRIERTIE